MLGRVGGAPAQGREPRLHNSVPPFKQNCLGNPSNNVQRRPFNKACQAVVASALQKLGSILIRQSGALALQDSLSHVKSASSIASVTVEVIQSWT